MVSGSSESGSGRKSEENQDLHSIEEVEERRNQGQEELTVEREKELEEVRSSRARECRTTEVYSAV